MSDRSLTFFGTKYETITETWPVELCAVHGVPLYSLKGYGRFPDTPFVVVGGLAVSPAAGEVPELPTAAGIFLGVCSLSVYARRRATAGGRASRQL